MQLNQPSFVTTQVVGSWHRRFFQQRSTRAGVTYQREMPCDVAVERPCARVIGVILDHDVSAQAQHLDFATLWVLRVCDGMAVPVAVAFVQNVHVVAV